MNKRIANELTSDGMSVVFFLLLYVNFYAPQDTLLGARRISSYNDTILRAARKRNSRVCVIQREFK